MARVVKKPEERRREIVNLAQKLFLENEYDATSLNDVISALGIAKGTVYHYFKSKDELLDAVVANMAHEYLLSVQSKMSSEKGNALTKMKALSFAMNVSSEWDTTIHQLHKPGNMGLHVRLLGLLVRGLAPIMAEVIRQGCEEGVFEASNPLETAEILLAGFQFITDIGVFPWDQEELERRTKAFSSIAEVQLRAASGSLSFL